MSRGISGCMFGSVSGAVSSFLLLCHGLWNPHVHVTMPQDKRSLSCRSSCLGELSYCCRKEDHFQGPQLGSCLTLGNKLSEETHVLTKQEILLGKGTRVESSRVREPRRTALPMARSLGFYGDGISFRVVFGQSF